MEWLINLAYYIVPFVVLLGILVFVHELGHFLVAKLVGVKVEEFSIGFGRKLWSFNDKSGTEWKICAIPLGGYVKMLGDADATSTTADENVKTLSEEEKKSAFNYQSPYKKLAISLAGPAANYIFAILIFASIFLFVGKIEFPAIVGEVIKGGAAEQAGMLVNDKVLSVNGVKVESFEELRREVDMSVDGKVKLEVERNGQMINLAFPLKVIEVADVDGSMQKKSMIGIKSVNSIEVKPANFSVLEALKDATLESWNVTTLTLRGVGQMLTGKRSSDEVGGIIRIAEMSGDISKKDGSLDFLVFMALLSINLGLINLFPIPVLDGGHVVIYVIEILTGRELNEKVKEVMFKFGFFLIIALMVFATWNDFVRLFHRWFS